MITFMDGRGNITVIGTYHEWVKFLEKIELSNVKTGELVGSRYILGTAEEVAEIPADGDGHVKL